MERVLAGIELRYHAGAPSALPADGGEDARNLLDVSRRRRVVQEPQTTGLGVVAAIRATVSGLSPTPCLSA